MKIIVESFSKCTAEVTPIKQTLIVKVDHLLHIHLVLVSNTERLPGDCFLMGASNVDAELLEPG